MDEIDMSSLVSVEVNDNVMRINNTDTTKAAILNHGRKMIKRPNPVYMIRLIREVEVETNEGIMCGYDGDYLAHDPISGHIWPVSAEYVEQHYDRAPDEGEDENDEGEGL